jgi:hypothetical protein
MNRWSKLLFIPFFTAIALLPLRAQQQPVVGVSIETVNVGTTFLQVTRDTNGLLIFPGGTSTFGSQSSGGTIVSTTPNESYGPAGTPIIIGAYASGTFLRTSYTYSFYVNGVHIGSSSAPVNPPNRDYAEWTPPQPGSYFLTVKATDGENTATSLPIRFFATGTVVNSPVTGQLVPAGSSVVLKGDATVAQGFIKQIQFYDSVNGGAYATIGSADTTLPYSLIFTPNGAAGTTHDIKAQATDNNGNLLGMSAPVRLNIVTAIPPVPTCTLTSPANGAVIGIPPTGNSIPVLVDANSTSGRIAKVELYIDGVLFSTNTNYPYTFTWSPTVVGKYTLVALAYDDKYNVIASTQNLVSIAPPPTVAVTIPTGGGTVVGGSPIRLSAAVSDSNTDPISGAPVGIRTVQFFVDTEFVGEATTADTSGYYSVSATLTQKVDTNGNPIMSVITAIATDGAGISGVSPGVSVNVTRGGSSTPPSVIGIAPTVSVTSPVAGTQITVNTPVLLTANAADADGFITSVQFYAGTVSLGTSTKYPYQVTWTPTSLGTYNLTAKVNDNDGNTVTSSIVQVSVIDPTPAAPTVTMVSPANNANVLVGSAQQLKATVVTTGSVGGVQFFVNGQPFGSLITSFPYQTSWTPGTPGSYTLAARATNATGLQGTSGPITVVVSGGVPPTVTLTSPANGAAISVNAAQPLTATATSTTATITSVQFFVNGVPVGTDTVFPYTGTWTPTSAGTYTIVARATDSLGNTSDSASASVTVAGGAAPTVAVTNPAANSTYTVGTALTLNATASDSDGTVSSVQFMVNGVAQGAAATTAPYAGTWTPLAAGTYTVTAQATDNTGNTTTSAPITVNITANGAPTVSIITPKTGATVSASTVVTLTASAADADGTVARVRFFGNGTVIGTPVTAAPFSTGWTPTAAGTYNIVAEATDNSGNVTNSAPITLTVIANQPPTVSVIAPATGYITTSGMPVLVSASANDADGTIAQVRLLVNGSAITAPLTKPPYSSTWTPGSAGTYSIVAEATDNSGNVTSSQPVSVTVIGNTAPTVSISAPVSGSTVRVGATTTIDVSAKDNDGVVASVQVYVNGGALSAPITTFPYRASWTPTAEGVYRISAIATDNAGASTTSATSTVLAVSALSAATDRVYSGPFNGLGDAGKFEVVVTSSTATFIGYSTAAPAKVYYVPDMTLDAAGGFSGTDANGHTITGSVNDTGVTVMIDNKTLLIGVVTNGASPIPAGHYTGSIVGASNSAIDAIVGSDGSVMLYLVNGSSVDAAAGMLTTTGVTTAPLTTALAGSKITLKVDPLSSFLTGTITGANAGSIVGALATGAAFSDGALRNLSTRGQVGTGANVLIAGFVVAGDTPKQVLIRAIGPSLAQFGITSPLADPQLQLYKGTTLIGANDNWENNADVVNACTKVSAFSVSPTSKDSALLVTLVPGAYTAQVSGVNNTTGVALVEIWDVDNASPFTAQKVINVSTRGAVGAGQAQLIAGFVVSGNIAKKVLIRAVGPTLASPPFNLPGTLSDPVLRLSHFVNNVDTVVRENNDWSLGNDPTLVIDAANKVGAFPLNANSKDAVILITLPPGTYTAQMTGSGGATGIGLVEVYEVP